MPTLTQPAAARPLVPRRISHSVLHQKLSIAVDPQRCAIWGTTELLLRRLPSDTPAPADASGVPGADPARTGGGAKGTGEGGAQGAGGTPPAQGHGQVHLHARGIDILSCHVEGQLAAFQLWESSPRLLSSIASDRAYAETRASLQAPQAVAREPSAAASPEGAGPLSPLSPLSPQSPLSPGGSRGASTRAGKGTRKGAGGGAGGVGRKEASAAKPPPAGAPRGSPRGKGDELEANERDLLRRAVRRLQVGSLEEASGAVRDEYIGLLEEERLPELTIWLPASLIRPTPQDQSPSGAPGVQHAHGNGTSGTPAVRHSEAPGADGGDQRVLRVLIEFRVESPVGGVVFDRGSRCAFTSGVPQRARCWFPCLDSPGFRSTFDVHVSVPAGLVAASSGEIMAQRPLPGAPPSGITKGNDPFPATGTPPQINHHFHPEATPEATPGSGRATQEAPELQQQHQTDPRQGGQAPGESPCRPSQGEPGWREFQFRMPVPILASHLALVVGPLSRHSAASLAPGMHEAHQAQAALGSPRRDGALASPPPARHTGATGGTPQGTQPLSPQPSLQAPGTGDGAGGGGQPEGGDGGVPLGITFLCHESVAPFLAPLASCLVAAHRLFEEYLGSPFPFKHLHVAVLPCSCQVSRRATSLASLLLLSPSLVPRPRAIDSALSAPSKVVRLLASQWFGMFVRPDSPADQWLLSGLAAYLSHLYTKRHLGPAEASFRRAQENEAVCFADVEGNPELRASWRATGAPGAAAAAAAGEGGRVGAEGSGGEVQAQLQVVASDLVSLDKAASAVREKKALAVVEMLERQMGAEAFRRVLQRIVLKAHAAAAAPAASGAPEASSAVAASSKGLSTAQFRHLANKVGNLERPFLKEFFPLWLDKPGCPVLDLTFSYAKRKSTLELAVRRRSTAPRAPGASVAVGHKGTPGGSKDSQQHGAQGGAEMGMPWVHQGWAGMMTVRVQETEGHYDHQCLPLGGDPFMLIELPCHSRLTARRMGAPKRGPGRRAAGEAPGAGDEEDEGGGLQADGAPVGEGVNGGAAGGGAGGGGGAAGAGAAGPAGDTPILWLRVDPEREYLSHVAVRQPPHMWAAFLEHETRDIPGQLQAIAALGRFANGASAAALSGCLANPGVFFRVRAEAAAALAGCRTESDPLLGLRHLLRYYHDRFFYSRGGAASGVPGTGPGRGGEQANGHPGPELMSPEHKASGPSGPGDLAEAGAEGALVSSSGPRGSDEWLQSPPGGASAGAGGAGREGGGTGEGLSERWQGEGEGEGAHAEHGRRLPKPNDFGDWAEHFVQRGVVAGVASARDDRGRSPVEAVSFLAQVLKHNDNSLNAFEDYTWVASLLNATCLLDLAGRRTDGAAPTAQGGEEGDGDAEAREAAGSRAEIQAAARKLLKQVERYLAYDHVLPCPGRIVTRACLRALGALACQLPNVDLQALQEMLQWRYAAAPPTSQHDHQGLLPGTPAHYGTALSGAGSSVSLAPGAGKGDLEDGSQASIRLQAKKVLFDLRVAAAREEAAAAAEQGAGPPEPPLQATAPAAGARGSKATKSGPKSSLKGGQKGVGPQKGGGALDAAVAALVQQALGDPSPVVGSKLLAYGASMVRRLLAEYQSYGTLGSLGAPGPGGAAAAVAGVGGEGSGGGARLSVSKGTMSQILTAMHSAAAFAHPHLRTSLYLLAQALSNQPIFQPKALPPTPSGASRARDPRTALGAPKGSKDAPGIMVRLSRVPSSGSAGAASLAGTRPKLEPLKLKLGSADGALGAVGTPGGPHGGPPAPAPKIEPVKLRLGGAAGARGGASEPCMSAGSSGRAGGRRGSLGGLSQRERAGPAFSGDGRATVSSGGKPPKLKLRIKPSGTFSPSEGAPAAAKPEPSGSFGAPAGSQQKSSGGGKGRADRSPLPVQEESAGGNLSSFQGLPDGVLTEGRPSPARGGLGEIEGGVSMGASRAGGGNVEEEAEPVVVDDEIMSPWRSGPDDAAPRVDFVVPKVEVGAPVTGLGHDVKMLDAPPVTEAAQEGAGSAGPHGPALEPDGGRSAHQAFSPVLASTPEVPGGDLGPPGEGPDNDPVPAVKEEAGEPSGTLQGPGVPAAPEASGAPGASPSRQLSGQLSGGGSEVRPLRSAGEGGRDGGVSLGSGGGEAENLSGMQGSCAPNPKEGHVKKKSKRREGETEEEYQERKRRKKEKKEGKKKREKEKEKRRQGAGDGAVKEEARHSLSPTHISRASS